MKKDAWAVKLRSESELRALECQPKTTPSPTLLKKIICLCAAPKDLALCRVELALISLKQLYYDKGNKARSLLARKLCDPTHMTSPQQIKNRLGCLLYHPQDIVCSFEEIYTDLYNNPRIPHDSPSRDLLDPMHQYLEQSGISQLQPLDLLFSLLRRKLNLPSKHYLPIRLLDLMASPVSTIGPFFPSCFPICVNSNAFLQDTSIPSNMQRSFITLIPKPDKDPSLCASYRPIALLKSFLPA